MSGILSNEQPSPELAESIAALAQDCIDVSNFGQALKYLLEADRMSALPVEYSSDIAFCYERLDDLERAIHFYNKYLDSDPFNDNVWFNLGTIYAKLTQFEKSIEAFEYSLALNDNNSSSLYNLAVVYLNLERFRESADTFARFNECEEDNLSGIIGLANAQLGLNDYKGACESFRRAYYLDNNCQEAMLGITAVMAIIDYNEGNRNSFFMRLEEIVKRDSTWIGTIYKVMPQLISDKEFMNFIDKVKKKWIDANIEGFKKDGYRIKIPTINGISQIHGEKYKNIKPLGEIHIFYNGKKNGKFWYEYWSRNQHSKTTPEISHSIKFNTYVEANNFAKSFDTYFAKYVQILMQTDIHLEKYNLLWLNDYKKPWTNKRFCKHFRITGYISDVEAEPGSEWETILNTMEKYK